MRLAIFDIDGTLVTCPSERRFWRYLVTKGRQGPRQLGAHLFFVLRYLLVGGGIGALRKNKAYLSGLRREDIDRLAGEFVERKLIAALFEPAVRRLREHQIRGDTVVLMSGTLEPIARHLAAHLGVQHIWCTICAERGGRYLAQPPVMHPYAGSKLSLARLLAHSLRLDLGRAAAYGDSVHDLELLEAVGEAVAVCPDARLERAARRHGWEILADDPSVRGAQVS
jgi:HAD superfamily hydrolase (TIGR01490 family)